MHQSGTCFLVGIAWCSATIIAAGPISTTPTPIDIAQQIDGLMNDHWRQTSEQPAPPAEPLRLARRTSLALHGSIPSLQQLRALEPKTGQPDWLIVWTDELLADRRFANYLAERLARAMVPLSGEPFPVYRRSRFVDWLSKQIHDGVGYDEMVRHMIADDGLWTEGPVNFITGYMHDPIPLAGQTTRAFLGLRIDCAQCHNDFFRKWKQQDFLGIAGYYGNVEVGLRGVRDDKKAKPIENPATKEKSQIEPAVPFLPEIVPTTGRPRERLASWVTDQRNEYFAKAIANRMWALLTGRPIIEPIDDLEKPPRLPDVLEVLADDFRQHGHDLRRLARTIVLTQHFQSQSARDLPTTMEAEQAFAAFPIALLRTDQLAHSMVQATTVFNNTLDRALIVRIANAIERGDFTKRHGDPGNEEMEPRGETIAERLMLMNNPKVQNMLKAELFSASGYVSRYASTDEKAVDTAFLICLTRRPTAEERSHFVAELAGTKGNQREEVMRDLFWALVNSTEFSWSY